MNWTALITSSADRQLKRLPRDAYIRIRAAIDGMELDPWRGDIIKLGGATDEWRRRVGDYRLKFRVFQDDHVIQIFEIERRTSRTY